MKTTLPSITDRNLSNTFGATANSRLKKLITGVILILSWSLLLWINFYAELSIAMHIVAIPVLFLLTSGLAAFALERGELVIEPELS